MRIFAYDGTEEEKNLIVEEQLAEGFVLTHIHNIVEGDYLGFMRDGTIIVPPSTTEERIDEIEGALNALLGGEDNEE